MCPLTTPSEVDALHEHVCFENISRNECVVTFITNKTPYQVYNTSVSSVCILKMPAGVDVLQHWSQSKSGSSSSWPPTSNHHPQTPGSLQGFHDHQQHHQNHNHIMKFLNIYFNHNFQPGDDDDIRRI